MANGYDGGESQNSRSGFVIGLFTGAMLGTGLGLLFAPRAGSELRGQIADSTTGAGKEVLKKYRQASDLVSETVDELATRGHHAYDRALDVISRAKGEAVQAAGEIPNSTLRN